MPDLLDALLTLDHPDVYARWRDAKLERAPHSLDQLIVEVSDPSHLSMPEREASLDRCRSANMAIYVSDPDDAADKAIPRRLGEQLGLKNLDHNPGADEDDLTSLRVQTDALRLGYIPYTNRPIAWHTDGYYNDQDRQINAFILHCVSPAEEGGDNGLIDPEMLYIRLRERDPAHIEALTNTTVMTIPANVVDSVQQRPPSVGPVFRRGERGHLALRYTDRRRNIEWHDDAATQSAVDAVRDLLEDRETPRFEARLESGWGVICNNVLHRRSGFEDGPRQSRLLYRARYYERVTGT
jgi:alpha-ketoglutarate-dependent taurine dioxygenase